ncbi:MAG: cytochrome b N-terminal domain-containing protein [Candidatus Wallbacteria bacterium]|nr:cytochrome b N-terminal domain-containing protein [Candidatus Wallbacteria bacterium]
MENEEPPKERVVKPQEALEGIEAGKGFQERLIHKVTSSELWRSVIRHGSPALRRNRALTVISNFFLHLHPLSIPRRALAFAHTWCMGGITFLLFLVLTVSGVLLMFYYVPEVGRAYEDMKDLQFAVSFGMLMRNLHRWSAHAMVVAVILHMMRVFYSGAYKPPRQFNWVIGVSLLVLTLLLSFTGYLLPWDQLSLWAITVGANMAGATPLVGYQGPFHELLGARVDNDVRFLLLGGTLVGQNALLRFYVLHCIVLPLVAVLGMAIHFWRVRKDGGISKPL